MFYEFDHPIVNDYFFQGFDSNFDFPSHIHYNYELIMVDTGEMIVTVNDKEYLLGAGDAVVIFPNQIHSMYTPKKSSHKLYIFAPNLVSAYTQKVGEKVPSSHIFQPGMLCNEMSKNISASSGILEVKGFLYCICSEFHKKAEYVDVDTDSKSLLFRIFKFIQMNYGKNCTLNDLSHHTGYEYSYLSRYFKKIVGISFNDYVNKVRISNVCYLLSNSDMNMLEISSECGFKSLRSMNRNFKDQVGITPSEYRRDKVRVHSGFNIKDID